MGSNNSTEGREDNHSGVQEDGTVELEFEILARRPGHGRKSKRAVNTRANSRGRHRRALGAAVAGLHGVFRSFLWGLPWKGVGLGLGVVATTTCWVTAATLCAFLPRASKLVGLLSVLSRGSVLGLTLPNPGKTQHLLRPLRPLSGPFTVFAVLWAVMPITLPGLWRSLMYWQRSLPVVTSFFVTNARAKRARRRGNYAHAEQLWEARHAVAAEQLFCILCDLQGFYLKLGQILATKTDMLPRPYTASLQRLLDRMPPTPFRQVQKSIERELDAKLPDLFLCVDPFPLASATVAQVHQARLPSGRDVVVKVQHRNTKRMMAADLHNMRMGCALLDRMHVSLGFDLASVVREYCEQVPLEFDFAREAAMAESIRCTLHDHAQHFPLLRQVVVPEMLLFLSTPRLLTMQHVDGVPLLDIADMDHEIKKSLVSALVLAYGIMILRGGLFHSDPHPGNLLACCSPGRTLESGGHDIKVAIIDFGQVKQLCDESRLRYALLVCALAAREDHLLVATLREMGLVVENCSTEFEAIAGYILFDTRMDFPEAHQSPLDPLANEGWRSAKVPNLPQDLFMIVRVITLLRGVMHSLGIDVSSALMWRPLALQTIAELSARDGVAGPGGTHLPGVRPYTPVASPRAGDGRRSDGGGSSGGERAAPAVSPRHTWSPSWQQQQSQQGWGSAVGSPAPPAANGSPTQAEAASELANFLSYQQLMSSGSTLT